jgi:hypothetical protein
MKSHLRAVPPATEPQDEKRVPDLSYEYRNRNYVMNRDWSRVLIAGDRAKPLPFFERIKRTWWK